MGDFNFDNKIENQKNLHPDYKDAWIVIKTIINI